MRIALGLVVVAGCGRVAFDPLADGGASSDGGVADALAGGCPAGYAAMGTSCYRGEFVTGMPWLAAEAACEADGAHLVVLDSAAELAMFDASDAFWIGATDLVTEGTYLTVANQPVFPGWEPGEPDAGTSENCATLTAAGMTSAECNNPDDYVCEYDGIAVVPAAWGM